MVFMVINTIFQSINHFPLMERFWITGTILNYRFVMKAMSNTPCALIRVLYTGKGKWKVGVVGVSILQNRPDPSGGLEREGSEAELEGHRADWRKENDDGRACAAPFHFRPALTTVSFSAGASAGRGVVLLHHVDHRTSQSFAQNQACSRRSANV